MDVVFDLDSTPGLVFLLVIFAGLALVVRGIAKWRSKGDSIDWSPSKDSSEGKPNFMPVGKQNYLLQQQKIITAPSVLTPEKIVLPSNTYKKLTEVKEMTEELFHQGGFYPAREYGKIYFIGPFGEIFYIYLEEDQALCIEYADDFNLAVEEKFSLFARYPISLGDNLLPKIAEDIREYAENV